MSCLYRFGLFLKYFSSPESAIFFTASAFPFLPYLHFTLCHAFSSASKYELILLSRKNKRMMLFVVAKNDLLDEKMKPHHRNLWIVKAVEKEYSWKRNILKPDFRLFNFHDNMPLVYTMAKYYTQTIKERTYQLTTVFTALSLGHFTVWRVFVIFFTADSLLFSFCSSKQKHRKRNVKHPVSH